MFTKADFLDNENNNYHTENGIEMANNFGTPEEQKLMMQIQKDHYARGHINPDEIEARMGIVKKYWHMLENVQESPAQGITDAAAAAGMKDYNDYKGIQIHNLRKELKRVRKILLNLQDIDPMDGSSDMQDDIRNMLKGYKDMIDNMESAFNKLTIGRHRKESIEEEGEWGKESPEWFRSVDKAQTDKAKWALESAISKLGHAIEYRGENSNKFFNTGDKAGVGNLMSMQSKLKELHANWEKETELYGM